MLNFKEYITKPIVSFDFDDTISLLTWDGDDGDYVRDDSGTPIGYLNAQIAKKIEDYFHHKFRIYLVTSRYESTKPEVIEFLKSAYASDLHEREKNPLSRCFAGIHFTNGRYKAETCKLLDVKIHYDDDPEELQRLELVGITGIKVGNKQ